MKKVLLTGAMILLGSYGAQASGLYFGVGYSQSKPDMKVNTITASSSDTGVGEAYEGMNGIYGWPGSNESKLNGTWAKPWSAGLPEEWKFYPEKTNTYSFSVGWAIPRNPFRFEFEYLKTSYKVRDWDMIVRDPNGAWCSDNTCSGTQTPTTSYLFDLYYEDFEIRKNDITSYMLNVLFEIPGLGNIDPYIGFGYGFSKIDTSISGIKGGTDNEATQQYIAGVEYRVPDSPLIVGIEYRKLKMDDAKERDEPESSFKYENDIIMFKVKYDFISDVF
ncbi:MAG: outer membrane protein [Alphaproteobacteria bacterium]